MNYEELNVIVEELISSKRSVLDFKDKKVAYIKAIGRQFAIKYKHVVDKDSQEANNYLSILIEIRTLVKSKLKMNDALMNRFKQENNY